MTAPTGIRKTVQYLPEVISLRVSAEAKEQIRAAAEKGGETVGDYIRRVLAAQGMSEVAVYADSVRGRPLDERAAAKAAQKAEDAKARALKAVKAKTRKAKASKPAKASKAKASKPAKAKASKPAKAKASKPAKASKARTAQQATIDGSWDTVDARTGEVVS